MPDAVADHASVSAPSRTGLVLTGGGARAAYQAGVLKAVFRLVAHERKGPCTNPFEVICGTSAGAINATALACGAHSPRAAMRHMLGIWANIRTADVYHSDYLGIIRTGAKWLTMLSLGWMLARLTRSRPRSLLDNEPLADLLARSMDFAQLQHNFGTGCLRALGVTASGYTTGRHLTFYQSADSILPWQRSLRHAVRTRITTNHLLASSAIPFVFPARRVMVGEYAEWCGDGAMRHLAPISPAIHLGAQRILVVGAGRGHENPPSEQSGEHPSLAQVGAHALSSIFLDSLSADVEQLERTNRVAHLLSDDMRRHLNVWPIDVLAITPSRNLDEIAARHLSELPAPMRALLSAVGVSSTPGHSRGAGLLSYLLFEPGYTRELIELGWRDTMARATEVRSFFATTAHSKANLLFNPAHRLPQ